MASVASGRSGTAKVWDPLVRLFHWTVVTCVIIAFATQNSDSLHTTAGYIVMGALAVRVIWGLIGTRHARFVDFVRSPRVVVNYANAVMRGTEPRYMGHNPLGGLMVVLLMICLAVITVSGWMMTTDAYWGIAWVRHLHQYTAYLLLAFVTLHLSGVVWESVRHGENLVRAMITGRKPVAVERPTPADRAPAAAREASNAD